MELTKKLAIALAVELAARIRSKEAVFSDSLYVLLEAVIEFPELKDDRAVRQCMLAIKEKIVG
jgi:hypothetical protein